MNALAQTGASQYHAQLGLPDKELIVIHKWDVGTSGPLALRCPTRPQWHESHE